MVEPRVSQLKRHRPTATLLGIMVLLIALGLAMHNDLQRAHGRFAEVGAEIESTLTRRLDNLNAALRSLSGMHHAMTRLSQQELSAFAQEIERSHPYVKAIVQLRQIADAERGPYEAEMREAGFPTFSLRTFTSDGSLSESPNKVQYMVAHAVEPLDPALARYLGLDVYSSPLLQNAIARAIASADICSSATTPRV